LGLILSAGRENAGIPEFSVDKLNVNTLFVKGFVTLPAMPTAGEWQAGVSRPTKTLATA